MKSSWAKTVNRPEVSEYCTRVLVSQRLLNE